MARSPSSFSSYSAALRYLEDRVNVERTPQDRVSSDTFKLDRLKAILEKLDNPERDLKFVHVAGSKGKGSTVEMLSSALDSCGYAVGVYTSPHLVDVRERIRLGPDMIGEKEFADAMSRVRGAADVLARKHGEATYFELLTAAAFVHFAQMAVDLAVLETGLGGRLDCTNVVSPEVCGLTHIQLEHTAILGDTLAKIAREKAGIMKPGVTAISVPQEPEVLEVFREVSGQVGATLAVLGTDIEYSCRFEATHDRGPHARICVSTERSEFEHISVPLSGEHQAPNCGLALAILDKLRERGFETPERQVAEGLARTPRNGRLEEVHPSPRIVVDGAHNPPSVEAVVKAIGAQMRFDSMVVVFGCQGQGHPRDARPDLEGGGQDHLHAPPTTRGRWTRRSCSAATSR
ncbi:MAG: Mur ligase family protein [Phycisphaerales bacterium]